MCNKTGCEAYHVFITRDCLVGMLSWALLSLEFLKTISHYYVWSNWHSNFRRHQIANMGKKFDGEQIVELFNHYSINRINQMIVSYYLITLFDHHTNGQTIQSTI